MLHPGALDAQAVRWGTWCSWARVKLPSLILPGHPSRIETLRRKRAKRARKGLLVHLMLESASHQTVPPGFPGDWVPLLPRLTPAPPSEANALFL